MQAELVTELQFSFPDQPGVLGKTSNAFGAASINMQAMMNLPQNGGTTTCMVLSGDLDKAKQVLADNGAENVQENQLLAVTVESKPGGLATVGDMLSEQGVNIQHLYASEAPGKTIIYMSTSDNAKAMEVLNG